MADAKWTEGRLKTFITSTLRGGFRKYPPKYNCLKAAFIDKRTNKLTGRLSAHYKCNHCSEAFPTSQVNVDHVEPIVDPAKGFEGWDVYISRLFCTQEELQVLCTDCHDIKTKEENKLRKRKKNGTN